MKQLISGIVLAAAAAMPAIAADMPVAVPAAFADAAPAYRWTGLYAGISGGHGWGTMRQGWTTSYYSGLGVYDGDMAESQRANGWLIGGTIGYNYQINRMVVGLEADFSLTGMKSNASAFETDVWQPGDRVDQRWSNGISWLSTIRGRLGFTVDRFLVYATGGLAIAKGTDRTEATYNDGAGRTANVVSRDSKTHLGWVLGVGVEAAITPQITAKLEYLHVDLGTQTYRNDLRAILIYANARISADIVRAGVNYRF